MTKPPEVIGNLQEYDSRYLAGIELFNQGEFYDSHDVWEDLWTEYRGPDRQFYQGLIQSAVALYHLSRGNLRGARRMYYSSRSYLAPYPPGHHGIDLARLLIEMEVCFRPYIDLPEDGKVAAVDAGSLPQIHGSEDVAPQNGPI